MKTSRLLTAFATAALLLGCAPGGQKAEGPYYIDIKDRAQLHEWFRYSPERPVVISGHRGGMVTGFPENCIESFEKTLTMMPSFFEIDPRMTKDSVIVLMHDATLDRVSDAAAVFGAENVLVRDKTLSELKQLNMAAQFVTDAGEAPYAGLHGEAVPDELRILSLDEVLDYLTAAGEFRYIIEIKDGGETGLAAADQLYATLKERGLLDRVIIGSFRDEVAAYITANYPDTHRSASPEVVVQFYFAALTGKKDFTCSYYVLQLPFGDARESYGLNLGTTTIINFAHAHDLAMQYWTVNDEADLAYLASVGAAALITDYPDRAAAVLQGMG